MLRSRDMQFAMNLSQSVAGAAALGELASTRAKNLQLRSFGEQMSENCRRIGSELGTLVASRQITLPREIPSDELAAATKLDNVRAERFDRAYLKETRRLTVRRIKMFKAEIKKGHDPVIQRFAIETLPMLEDHLEKEQELYRATEKRT